MSVDDLGMRPGELACLCGPGRLSDDSLDAHDLGRLATGFGLSALAQALALSALPEMSSLLAPTLGLLGAPYALLLVGAAIATLPAAFLIDAFGRRSAFALGGSLGVAGGLLAAFAATRGNFPMLCLGAFWLGIAQGFALFYRHIAARGSALATRAGLVVLAGGAVAAGGAPALVRLAGLFGEGAGPLLIVAAGLHALALWLATRLPHAIVPTRLETRPGAALSWRFWVATLAGALGWFFMAGGMLHGPLQLSLCQASRGFIGATMAWHLLAMYGPMALAARWPKFAPPAGSILGGLFAMALALYVLNVGASLGGVTVAILTVGAGWSLVNVGALRLLHDNGRPSRVALGLHDLCLLSAAAAGALAL
ncbi:MAG: MFS transporter [Methylocystis sp.]